MVELVSVAVSVANAVLSLLERISRFIVDNVSFFLSVVPMGDVVSIVVSMPILSKLLSLLQIF